MGGVDVTHLRLDGVSLLPYLEVNNKSSLTEGRTLFHHCNSEIFAIRQDGGQSIFVIFTSLKTKEKYFFLSFSFGPGGRFPSLPQDFTAFTVSLRVFH